MKDVQCYELFGGIALKNHAFSFLFSFSYTHAHTHIYIARQPLQRVGDSLEYRTYTVNIELTM